MAEATLWRCRTLAQGSWKVVIMGCVAYWCGGSGELVNSASYCGGGGGGVGGTWFQS